jgi:Skp family chaperone for outer membrane proteins
MKKATFAFAAGLVLLSFASCSSSSSFESDVKKMAGYMCRAQQLAVKAATDESAKKEMETLEKDAQAFSEKMKEKYKGMESDKAKNEQAEKIINEEMAKCK